MLKFLDKSGITLINKSDIIRIVRSSLSKIDPRLISHGERVGYIATEICKQSPDSTDFDMSKLFILSILHDIGAYKTEEIDDMVKFETDTTFDHSLYGYLFLKNTTDLSKYAEAILYHHTDYSSEELKSCEYARYAEIIHISDRSDILFQSGISSLDLIKKYSGNKFNPLYVDALEKAQQKNDLYTTTTTDQYISECEKITSNLNIETSEILDYLKLLVFAIDFRSPYTVTHTADTTIISLQIGKLLGLDEHTLQALYLGAFLHDIGKIAIPHTILEKPDKLDSHEFGIIMNHITEGEQILRGVISDEICDIALRHHEKLDGSGYSLGLTGEQLTTPQRIVAVADILSALSQERSYKKAFPKEKVIAILTEMKEDGKICPRIVDTVCKNYDMILNKTKISHDPAKKSYNNLVEEYNKIKRNQ